VSVLARGVKLQLVRSTDARELVGNVGWCFLPGKMSLKFSVKEDVGEVVAERYERSSIVVSIK
jgi:hypothetical protein